MNESELRALAREGARAQIYRLLETFPDLVGDVQAYDPIEHLKVALPAGGNGHEPILQHHRIVNEARANGEPAPVKRFMSAKARQAISRRMKAHWRKKRAERKEATK